MHKEHDSLVRSLAEACRRGDLVALRDTLDAGVIAVCDSGGHLPAVPDSIHGAQDVARFAAALLGERPDTELSIEAVNGRSGLALRHTGQAIAVASIDVAHSEISALWIVLNPDKLRGWHR
jgi:RNA polymerase sigma-70 factor (ECF subfamily)